MKLFRNEEEAVSPVIGVILMVAIVVILAAVIAAFVFGMAGTTSTTKNVAFTVSVGSSTAGTPTADIGVITAQGGTDLETMNQLQFSIDGAAAANVTTIAEAPLTPAPGYIATGDVVATGNNVIKGKRLILIASFEDGTEQVVFDRKF